MFLANSSPISSSRNEEILYSPPKQLNLVLKCSLLTVQFSSNYAAQLTSFLTYRKILPNLLRRRQLVMMNYAWDFRQSETEKYFEWTIIEFMFAGINMFWVRLRLVLARAARNGRGIFDYYDISVKGTMGRRKGEGKDSPLSSFASFSLVSS